MSAFAAPRTLSATKATSLVLRIALEHHEQGRFHEAAGLYREVSGIDPGNADAVFLLGLVAFSIRNYAAAEKLLALAARRMPKAVHVHRALGEARRMAGQTGAALESYWRALELDPENATSYIDVGEALMAVKPDGGNSALATACFARALLLDASCARAYDGLKKLHPVHVKRPLSNRLPAASLEGCPVQ